MDRPAGPCVAGITLAIVAAVMAVGVAEAGQGTIPAGHDLLETDPGSTHLAFQAGSTGIPAGFFGPGSDPFTGVVAFAGEPLGTYMGMDVGDADTVVQRLQPATLPQDTVPIELVALSLRSVEPIVVTYDDGQRGELWDVAAGASPTKPSTGQMLLRSHPASNGGTFDSQLRVIPILTFTRLSDGRTRVFDAAALPDQVLAGLVMTSRGSPWRPGCAPPALAVEGVNDAFCPGLTTGRTKVRTLEQALLAQHGVYPAQPRLEHFRCYRLLPDPQFAHRQVVLKDQFGRRKAEVTARAELCNPVRKWQETFLNRRAHLQCYRTTGPARDVPVAVRNQFGSQRLMVGAPTRLCLPTRKRLVGQNVLPTITVPIDHFQCYAVTTASPLRAVRATQQVTLRDQFLRETVRLGQAFRLCAPVTKDTWVAKHPVTHLVCYRTSGQEVDRRVEIRNQFERVRLRTVKSRILCVPSTKLRLDS